MGRDCYKIHDVDLILDYEEKKSEEPPRKKRKRNKKNKREKQGEEEEEKKDNSHVSTEKIENDVEIEIEKPFPIPDESTVQAINDKEQNIGSYNSIAHHSSFDSYMTGYIFTRMLCSLKTTESENKVYLMGKNFPLLIQKSQFCDYSAPHLAKSKLWK